MGSIIRNGDGKIWISLEMWDAGCEIERNLLMECANGQRHLDAASPMKKQAKAPAEQRSRTYGYTRAEQWKQKQRRRGINP